MIESASSLNPIDLVVGESVAGRDGEGLAGRFGNLNGDLCRLVASENGIQADSLDCVLSRNTRVIGFVHEPERKNSLFLLCVKKR